MVLGISALRAVLWHPLTSATTRKTTWHTFVHPVSIARQELEKKKPCPVNTYMNEYGAGAQADCKKCREGYQCPEQSIEGDPCDPGFYCPSNGSTIECNVGTYNTLTGQTDRSACKPCPAGYYCNETGLPDKKGHECPPGHFCAVRNEIARCGEGFMRPQPKGENAASCLPCENGRYCPANTTDGHITGYECPAGSYCPYNETAGTGKPKDCPFGRFCDNGTATPQPCEGGFYCPHKCISPIKCVYPFYCPPGSGEPQACQFGWKASNASGLRDNRGRFCTACEEGTYGDPDASDCHACPEGFYCPTGTYGPKIWNGTCSDELDAKCPIVCPMGAFCPRQSAYPTRCLPGTYNDKVGGTSITSCLECSAGTYNYYGGQAKCKACGSSAVSERGATVCSCTGLNRYFLTSDGSCRCKSGFVYYDETETMRTDGNSNENCQRTVEERCQANELRVSASRKCVVPQTYDCKEECGDSGGVLKPETGRCECSRFTEPWELCDDECVRNKPKISVKTNSRTGKAEMEVNYGDVTRTISLTNSYGLKEYDTQVRDCQVVSFSESGFEGKVSTEHLLVKSQQFFFIFANFFTRSL